jgi:hypothetical protein
MQLVQKLEGRTSAEAPGDGHCDTCTGVACHPTRNMIVSNHETAHAWASLSL